MMAIRQHLKGVRIEIHVQRNTTAPVVRVGYRIHGSRVYPHEIKRYKDLIRQAQIFGIRAKDVVKYPHFILRGTIYNRKIYLYSMYSSYRVKSFKERYKALVGLYRACHTPLVNDILLQDYAWTPLEQDSLVDTIIHKYHGTGFMLQDPTSYVDFQEFNPLRFPAVVGLSTLRFFNKRSVVLYLDAMDNKNKRRISVGRITVPNELAPEYLRSKMAVVDYYAMEKRCRLISPGVKTLIPITDDSGEYQISDYDSLMWNTKEVWSWGKT